jgi:transcriptional regulator with XRE-family HTH domain
MSENDPTIYIEPEDFKVFLAARLTEARHKGLNVADFARQVGLARTKIYALLTGERLPSDADLKKLGARFVIAVGDPPKKKKS